LLALGNEQAGRLRLYRVPLDPPGKPTPISAPTVARNVAISPNGANLAVLDAAGHCAIYSTDQPEELRIVNNPEPLAPVLWADPGTVYVQRQRTFNEIPAVVYKLNLASERLEKWKEISPRDLVGVNAITRILIAKNQTSYAYNSRRVLSELLLVDGWR
jgi:hypothetical protein